MMQTCSHSSHDSGEQLFATASRADIWFVLEHPQTYGSSALADSGLPEAIIRRLETAAAQVQNGRIQLIKRSSATPNNGLAFFVVVNHEEQPNLYEFKLEKVEDLLDLDLLAIAREDPAYRKHDRTEPLFLVCTNGKRDPCCSSLGMPVYREMRSRYGEQVWQAAHVGGHRFAPAVVVLPSGANYGYVTSENMDALVSATHQNDVYLAGYRGRSCYAKHVQAADAFLRRQTGLTRLLQFKLIELETPSEHRWMLHFADRYSENRYCVQILEKPGAVSVLKSCSDHEESKLSQFILEDFRSFTHGPGPD